MKYRFGMEYYDKTLQKLHIAKLQQELHQKMFANLFENRATVIGPGEEMPGHKPQTTSHHGKPLQVGH